MPAALGSVAFYGPGEMLAGYLPDLQRTILTPLRARSYDESTLARLGDIHDRHR